MSVQTESLVRLVSRLATEVGPVELVTESSAVPRLKVATETVPITVDLIRWDQIVARVNNDGPGTSVFFQADGPQAPDHLVTFLKPYAKESLF
jgi:hypothetical protein